MIRYYLKNIEHDLALASDGAAGYDVRADLAELNPRVVNPGERWIFGTGLHLEIPRGCVGLVCSRSGIAAHDGVVVLNAPGPIDSDYRGEVKVILANLSTGHGAQPFAVRHGDRIAQILFCPVFSPDCARVPSTDRTNLLHRVASLSDLSPSSRGDGGLGSTGR